MPKVVLLNGVSSAGKSTLAKALQDIALQPLLHVQMDSFLSMMPARYANHDDAFAFIERKTTWTPEIAIAIGPYGARLMRGMRRSIAALAGEGLSMIIDDVMLDDDIKDYRQLLSAFDFFVVGVECELRDAEARERQRGDRDIGLARWQYTRVHKGVDYDLIVNTSRHSSLECAREIGSAFDL